MHGTAEKTVQDIESLLARTGLGDTHARQILIDDIIERAWPRLERQARYLLRSQFPGLRDRLVVTGDVMGELFVRVRRSLHTLLNDGSLSGARHALNVAARQLRFVLLDFSSERKREAELFVQPGQASDSEDGPFGTPEAIDPGQTPSELAEAADEIDLLREHFETLPAPYREVLDLHYYASLSLKQIAALLGLEEEATKKRLQRARRALGLAMIQHTAPEPTLSASGVN